MVVNKSPMSKACLEYIHLKQNKKTPRTLTNSLNLKYIANRYICLRRRRRKKKNEKGERQGERTVAIRSLFFKNI